MAEVTNAAEQPAPPIPAPAPKTDSRFKSLLKRFLSTTFWFAVGTIFILWSIIEKKTALLKSVPAIGSHIPRTPFFLLGLGLWSLSEARAIVEREYQAEYKKNRLSPHAWKIPLVMMQSFILRMAGLYFVLVGFHVLPLITAMAAWIFGLILFVGYLFWYFVAYFKNRLPSISGFPISVAGLGLAALSFISWVVLQASFLSLTLALFSLLAALIGLRNPSGKYATEIKLLLIVITFALLFPIGLNAIPFGKSYVQLVELKLVTPNIKGDIDKMAYANDKIAFSQKLDDSYYLRVISAEGGDPNAQNGLKIAAGDGAFHPVFVENGSSIMLDPTTDGQRSLWQVDAQTGAITDLRDGIEPLENGVNWSDKTGQFLYVTRSSDGYVLNAVDLSTHKTQVLMRSELPIHTPSWNFAGDSVAYCDGTHPTPYLFNVQTRETDAILNFENETDVSNEKRIAAVEQVIPAPDGFRYLYVTKLGSHRKINEVLTDGTKDAELADTTGELKSIAWLADAQKIVFEEKNYFDGFLFRTDVVKQLDANVGTSQTLIPSQLFCHSPAPSPDGVKIAFAGSQGLWYPSLGHQGIWIAVLR